MAAFTHFVFVDFENVPKVDLSLIADKPHVHVLLLLGKNQKKVDVPLYLQTHRHAGQTTPVTMEASGRNALDLTLAYYLGKAIERTPGAEYFVVSKDKDYDATLAHLKADGVRVSRHDSFAALPFLAPPKKSAPSKPPFRARPEPVARPAVTPPVAIPAARKTTTDKYQQLLGQIQSGRNRPGTRARLMHYIHTVYGQKSTDGQESALIDRLCATGIIAIDERGKVTYL